MKGVPQPCEQMNDCEAFSGEMSTSVYSQVDGLDLSELSGHHVWPVRVRGNPISSAHGIVTGVENPAVTLLFPAGGRPDAAAVARLARDLRSFSISLDPAEYAGSEKRSDRRHWLELLANGLTFDLYGLAGAAGTAGPEMRHVYALPEGLEEQALEGITLVPGPHLSSGPVIVPVVRSLAWLGAQLARLDNVMAVAWHSARCVSGPEFFISSIDRWIQGGPFPSFALAALELTEAGAMQSEGLATFTGQELHIEAGFTDDPSSAGKLGLRLLDYLVNHGKLEETEGVTAPDGSGLRLEPTDNGRLVRVWRA